MSAASPIELRSGAGDRKAPLCRVGRSHEPAKQVEPLIKPRFRLPHHGGVHTARRRGSLCCETSAQATLRAITNKAGNRILAYGERPYSFTTLALASSS